MNATAFTATSSGLAEDSATEAAGLTATIVDSSWGHRIGNPPEPDGNLELKIPNLGVDATVAVDGNGNIANKFNQLSNEKWLALDSFGPNNAYALAGTWEISDTSGGAPTNAGAFVIGYRTPASGVPTAGTASYSVWTTGVASWPNQGKVTYDNTLFGAGTLTADFANGQITGSFDSIGVFSSNLGALNISASLSGADFKGTISSGGADLGSGTVSGGFYGPNADEIGGTWSTSGSRFAATGSFTGFAGAFPFPAATASVAISAPAMATAGGQTPTTAAAGYQVATAGGPNFGPLGPAPAQETVFAATQTIMQVVSTDSTGTHALVRPDLTTMGAGTTATILDPTQSQVQIFIPSLGIEGPLQIGGPGYSSGTTSGSVSAVYNVPLGTLQYTLLGTWYHDDNVGNAAGVSEFIGGYQTAPSSVPTSGTATYSLAGGVSGQGFIPGKYQPAAPALAVPYTPISISGDASISANFSTGQITGSFTNMKASLPDGSGAQPWNNVSLAATIASGGFSGTTATTSTPGGALGFASGTGTIKGYFYGPSANEVGAVWTLYDGTRAAIGTVGAARH